ncbi:MAG: 4-hydroxybutyrate dehydrogenase [Terrisporobacter othiniensis]|uniref:4-hydroxybutyrate dehydrogenase n=1 Tax=Terrisporobacter othiniensis TaxID=1577792 RepID=UPI00290C4129|nr:4-hydroxybutyrate dehydrogenase [Terrisporobacter othiniensis]MDU6984782.1 4-hydroxybutyrate dehydrogenase [Terrisporobacter othiniensis]
MKSFKLYPEILTFDKCEEFCSKFNINKNDLIITNEYIYKPFFQAFIKDATIIYRRDFGSGEPSDVMVEKIYNQVKNIDYKRVIGIGGGSILDVAKLFALEQITPVCDLFEKKFEPVKNKELILIPTTCGTGSEVTNISVLHLSSINSKLGLAHDEILADYAVLIPELLKVLPFKVFAASSIDALIHAIESFVSPKASVFTEMYSIESMKMILNGFKNIVVNRKDDLNNLLYDFLIASTYAGIAFGNAGTGAVHAMSYPLGSVYHVPHGEANYVCFTEIFKTYKKLNPNGKIKRLNNILVEILNCSEEEVFEELEKLLYKILPKKSLKGYGATEEDLLLFTDNVLTKQGRLMSNAYVTLDRDTIYNIYKTLY